jgi:hypothetical protein
VDVERSDSGGRRKTASSHALNLTQDRSRVRRVIGKRDAVVKICVAYANSDTTIMNSYLFV